MRLIFNAALQSAVAAQAQQFAQFQGEIADRLAQRFMTNRANAHTSEVRGASHAVMVSHPDATAALLAAADRITR